MPNIYTAEATVTGGHEEVGDVSIDSKVTLLTTEERGFNVAVELDVTPPQVTDAESAKHIVAEAHKVCPYSNATRGNVEITLIANGQQIA
jgi:organic hydroperoxide reductase OsmC/OhrA